MGNESSARRDFREEDEFAKFDGIETLGYRVLGVQPNSPASAAGLVSFLDFLVGCEGEMLMGSGEGLEEGEEYDDVDLPAVLRDSIGKELELLVHNIKSNSQRLVKITPSSTWGGAGLLGVTIRLDDYGGADERLIRLLSVEHNSPAAIAGLIPMTDYLLGTTSTSFDSDKILAEVLMMHVDRILEIYVYSSESDIVRVVTLMPTYSWGGKGLLGAEVGTGYLHRFPKSCRGTDGRSIERKIRMGMRPTEAALLYGGDTDKNKITSYNDDAKVEVMDLSTLTDAASGSTMCFAEQMEMEPDPAHGPKQDHMPMSQLERQIDLSKENFSQSQQTQNTSESTTEADSLFSGPPPCNEGCSIPTLMNAAPVTTSLPSELPSHSNIISGHKNSESLRVDLR